MIIRDSSCQNSCTRFVQRWFEEFSVTWVMGLSHLILFISNIIWLSYQRNRASLLKKLKHQFLLHEEDLWVIYFSSNSLVLHLAALLSSRVAFTFFAWVIHKKTNHFNQILNIINFLSYNWLVRLMAWDKIWTYTFKSNNFLMIIKEILIMLTL